MKQKIIFSLFLASILLLQTGTFGEAFGHAETPTKFGHDKHPDITITLHVEEIEISPKWREKWGSEVVTSYASWQDHHPENFKQGNIKTNISENNEGAGIMDKGHGYGNGKYISAKTFGMSGSEWQPNGLAKVSPPAKVYQHFTCSPPDYLYFHVKMIEDDSFYKAASPILGVVGVTAGVVSIVGSGGTVAVAGGIGLAAGGTDTVMTIADLVYDEKKDEMGHALITIPSSNLVPGKTFSQWFTVGDAKIKLKISTTMGSILAPGACTKPEPVNITPKSQILDQPKIKIGQDLNKVPKSEGTKTSFNYDHFKPQFHGLIDSSSEALVALAQSPDSDFVREADGFEKVSFSSSEIKQLRIEHSSEILQIVDDNFSGLEEILPTPDEFNALQNEAIVLKNNNQFIESHQKYEEVLTFYENWIISEGLDQPWAFPDAVYLTEPLMPSWIKQSANWWSQGIVSDREFATSLGFLVKEKIIKVDDVEVDSQGSIAISDSISIPKWIRTNAQWWVDGAISDEDFKQGIQFMVKEKLIDFKEPKKLSKTNPSMNTQTLNQLVQLESDILIANNLALEQFLEIQNFLTSSLDDSTKDAWNRYSENQNKDYMNNAIELEQKLNYIKSESTQTVKTMKDSQDATDSFFEFAKRNGFDPFVLKTNTEQNLPLLDAPSKIRTVNDLEDSGKYVKKFGNYIQTRTSLADSLIETQISQSSSYSKEFGTSEVEGDAISRYHGIDSRTGAIVCTDDNVCDSDKGEVCTKRTGSTEGKCVPTWFGIAHAWAPLVSMTDSDSQNNYDVDSLIDIYHEINHVEIEPLELKPTTPIPSEVEGNAVGSGIESEHESQNTVGQENEMEELISIKTISMNGAAYPISQFSLWKWTGECDDAWHYHVSTGHAVNLELTGMGDPDPNNCGFGKTMNLPISDSWMTQNQIDAFQELTGINPASSEAQMGGSGP